MVISLFTRVTCQSHANWPAPRRPNSESLDLRCPDCRLLIGNLDGVRGHDDLEPKALSQVVAEIGLALTPSAQLIKKGEIGGLERTQGWGTPEQAIDLLLNYRYGTNYRLLPGEIVHQCTNEPLHFQRAFGCRTLKRPTRHGTLPFLNMAMMLRRFQGQTL